MRSVKRIFIVLCCTSLFCGIGGLEPFLQTVAWIKMTYSFSRHDNLKKSLEKTFDGKHPCQICKIVKKLNQKSPTLQMASLSTKFDVFKRNGINFSTTLKVRTINYPEFIRARINTIYLSPPKTPPRTA